MKSRLFLTLLLFSSFLLAQTPQYNWIISYPNYNTDAGRLLASGDTVLIMRAEFVDVNTATSNQLIAFGVRPTTSHSSQWYIRSLQLWKNADDDPSTLNTSTDQLIDTKYSENFGFDPQQNPTSRVNFSLGGSIDLGENSIFFVAMEVEEFRTEDVYDDVEITDQNGVWFGLTVDKTQQDIVVNPPSEQSNNWDGDPDKHFTIKAVNLPITIKNAAPSIEEGPPNYSLKNMFFPNFLAMDGSTESKAQRIQDLTFTASVILDTLLIQDSLSYASFWIGWDADILELDTLVHGNLWHGKWDPISALTPLRIKTGEGDSARFLMLWFESWVTTTDDTPYVQINNNSLADLTFTVRKPGISPIFIEDERILDRWGIRYHTYRKLRNNSSNDLYTNGTKFDSWVKMILGDYTGPESSGNPTQGIGDGKVAFDDITLFADYLFLNADSSNWYNRFDIGAEGFYDPDGIAAYDDTTNFYDLLIFGANYYRTQKGMFNQKPVAAPDARVVLTPRVIETGNQVSITLHLSSLEPIMALHLKIGFDPLNLQFQNYSLSGFLNSQNNTPLVTFPEKLLQKGILDLNFLSFSEPLNGDVDFITLNFTGSGLQYEIPEIVEADVRNIAAQRLMVEVGEHSGSSYPVAFRLLQCYPNPFNDRTTIFLQIPSSEGGKYTLEIYNLQGELVKTITESFLKAGNYFFYWDGRDNYGFPVSSGIYLVRLSGVQKRILQKITLLK